MQIQPILGFLGLFWGYISHPAPPFGSRPPLFTYPGSAPAYRMELIKGGNCAVCRKIQIEIIDPHMLTSWGGGHVTIFRFSDHQWPSKGLLLSILADVVCTSQVGFHLNFHFLVSLVLYKQHNQFQNIICCLSSISVTNGSMCNCRKRQFSSVEHYMCDHYLFLFLSFFC